MTCSRTFSAQTFRLDYGLKRPQLHLDLWALFISKVTHRQSARILHCTPRAVAHRLNLLGDHCRRYHQHQLGLLAAADGLKGAFQLDELETYEHNRRLQPLTVPVVIHRGSYFVIDLAVAPLPCRGKLAPRHFKKKVDRESRLGKRRSGSRAAVENCLGALDSLTGPSRGLVLQTDRKHSYVSSVRRILGPRCVHSRTISTDRRDYGNPLFPVNHTLALLRDGLSRLVRRTWAASKLMARLELHLWIWVCWRNYVRGVTNRAPSVTPGMIVGVGLRPVRKEELLARKVIA